MQDGYLSRVTILFHLGFDRIPSIFLQNRLPLDNYDKELNRMMGHLMGW